MNRRELIVGAGAVLAASNVGALAEASEISSRARRLFERSTVFDANLGPPIYSADLPLPQATLDIIRNTGVSIIKTTMGGYGAPFDETVAEIAFYQRIIETHPDYLCQVRSLADIAAAKRRGKLGIVFSFESAACLEDKVDRIAIFRDLGVRVMQLGYNTDSPFGGGVLSAPDMTLTELGREAIAQMNQQGVALDLSHANPATTAAAMAASARPTLITHAGCAAVHPNPRNKTDAQLRALAESGGVFGVYDLFFLAPAGVQPTLDHYMAHMTHALNVCGEDHVGIGSDTTFTAFELTEEQRAGWDAETQRRIADGVAAPEEDGRLPYTEGLNRADRALVIADALLKRRYPERVVEKVLSANFIRALGQIW